MEVIDIGSIRGAGKYKEDKLLELIKKALSQGKGGKVAGYRLKAFLKEVYIGEGGPNLGALRKKIAELGYKQGIGNIGVTISEKKDIIGFYLKK